MGGLLKKVEAQVDLGERRCVGLLEVLAILDPAQVFISEDHFVTVDHLINNLNGPDRY